MKTLSLEVCKKLTDFFGDSAPIASSAGFLAGQVIQNYTVQDILSRPFLEALGEKLAWSKGIQVEECVPIPHWKYRGYDLLRAYWQSPDKFEYELLKLLEK